MENLLAEQGLPANDLVCVSSAGNQVWRTERHVIRISSGRFPGAFAHEARVVALIEGSVPVSPVLAHGVVAEREWIISERSHGQTVARAWSEMTRADQHSVGRQLGSVLKALHATAVPAGFENPWLSAAFHDPARLKDAYHPPPRLFPEFLRAAAALEGVDPDVLQQLEAYVASRLHCFTAAEENVLTHCDLHFDNLLWADGAITAVLDFEGSRLAPRDQELDTIVRFVRAPADYVGLPRGAEDVVDFAPALDDIGTTYPELFAGEDLVPRLEVYEVMWFLTELLHFPPRRRPHGPWRRLREIVSSGSPIGAMLRR
ncbi:phosphotransferase family protein [Saccharopolyspora taberi]|uniref:phosphotransferase family protein n=1 Tax=Saccharopolyspora taberi TaxID=60895 RepID=UPI0031D90DFC